jgi:hypothetical protein
MLDNARDVIEADPAAAQLLLADAVQQTIEYAFWKRALFQPRRKDLLRALHDIDPRAADLARELAAAQPGDSLPIVIELANHVLGVDAFFEWESDRS